MTDHSDTGPSDGAQATRGDTVAYLEGMLSEMTHLADVAGLKTLAYLIDVARAEAESLAKMPRRLD